MSSEPLPISCVSCRRKKIKCNKKDPCNQCTKRRLRCEFPSTFRNIKYKQDDADNYARDDSISQFNDYMGIHHNDNEDTSTTAHGGPDPSDEIKHEHDQLVQENRFLVQDNIRLNQLLKKLNISKDDVQDSRLSSTDDLHSHDKPKIIEPIGSKPSIKKLLDEPEPDANIRKISHIATVSPDDITHTRQPISISGETTEVGEKYFGPQSSGYMIEALKQHESENPKDPSTTNKDYFTVDTPKSGMDNLSPMFLRDSRKRALSSRQPSYYGSSRQPSYYGADNGHQPHTTARLNHTNSLIEQSLEKKQLPALIFNLIKFEHSNLWKGSQTHEHATKLNFEITVKLVNLFFESNPYYETFVNRTKILQFLNDYDSIQDKSWENDDDLLLLYMILVLSLQKLTPQEFIDLEVLSPNENINYNKYKEYVSTQILVHSFDELRHNLLNESIMSIQSYILCAEWFFVQQRYEECWSMVFHAVSIAYAIGLHIMGKFRRVKSVNSTGLKLETDDAGPTKISRTNSTTSEDEDNEEDVMRYKLWFALKNITGQVCSILGRPNPISIQVNSIVLQSNIESDTEASLKLKESTTQVLLKMGVSETLRVSNLMLIENFMKDCTIKDLISLDVKFNNEITTLESFYNNGLSVHSTAPEYDELTELPKKMDRTNILQDMITLYVNRIKIFEPFLKKYEKNDDYNIILKSLVVSILKFTDLMYKLLDEFLELLLKKYNTNLTKEVFTSSTIRYGRYFRTYYPFLHAFFYQGIIVIYTFLHYKFKEFVTSDQNGLLNNSVLDRLESNLILLNNFEKKVENRSNANAKLWTSNITYLLNKNLKHITIIREQQTEMIRKKQIKRIKSEPGSTMPELSVTEPLEDTVDDISPKTNHEPQSQQSFDDILDDGNNIGMNPSINDTEMDLYYGFHFDDPFWLTNPENLPYYLSSPSEDDRGSETRGKSNPVDSGQTSSNISMNELSSNPQLQVPQDHHHHRQQQPQQQFSRPPHQYQQHQHQRQQPHQFSQPIQHQQPEQLQYQPQYSHPSHPSQLLQHTPQEHHEQVKRYLQPSHQPSHQPQYQQYHAPNQYQQLPPQYPINQVNTQHPLQQNVYGYANQRSKSVYEPPTHSGRIYSDDSSLLNIPAGLQPVSSTSSIPPTVAQSPMNQINTQYYDKGNYLSSVDQQIIGHDWSNQLQQQQLQEQQLQEQQLQQQQLQQQLLQQQGLQQQQAQTMITDQTQSSGSNHNSIDDIYPF